MINFYKIEDVQSSKMYLEKKPEKFIVVFTIIILIIITTFIITTFFIKKIEYIKSEGTTIPLNKPINIVAKEDSLLKKIFVENNQIINRNSNIMSTDRLQEDNNLIKKEIVELENKVIELKKVLTAIEKHPEVPKYDNYDMETKDIYEKFKKQYMEASNFDFVKNQYKDILKEKINLVNKEIDKLERKNNDEILYKSTKSGTIYIPDNIEEGKVVPKGTLLYQIYNDNKKGILIFLNSDDVLKIKNNQNVNILYKINNTEHKLKGKIKEVSKFPEENKSNKELNYKVKISLEYNNIKNLENIYFNRATVFVEVKKQTLAQYIYEKVK